MNVNIFLNPAQTGQYRKSLKPNEITRPKTHNFATHPTP